MEQNPIDILGPDTQVRPNDGQNILARDETSVEEASPGVISMTMLEQSSMKAVFPVSRVRGHCDFSFDGFLDK